MRYIAAVIAVFAAVAALAAGAGAQPPDTAETGPVVELELVADGLAAPTYLEGREGELFIADQPGQIWRLDGTGEMPDEPFLDISDRMIELQSGYDERGLLGFALHPDFNQNRRFFVYYSAPLDADAPEGWDHTSYLSEFTVDSGRDRADPDSERVVMRIDQPQSNHNAGHITFGLDGRLYVPQGDGGGANDEGTGHPPEGNGQATENLLGSVLRIDVDGGEPYAVPADNPFIDDPDVADEVYAYGLRNPYALTFDIETGELYAADAGQDLFEAVYRIEAGANFGWPIREGSQCFDRGAPSDPPAECPEAGPRGEAISHPVVEYERGPETGSVIVGALPYRGAGLDGLNGQIILADWTSDVSNLAEPAGLVFIADASGTVDPVQGPWPALHEVEFSNRPDGAEEGELGRFVLAIGQDEVGEAYLLTTGESGPAGETGEVWRLARTVEADTGVAEPGPEEASPEPDEDDGTPWLGIALAIAVGVAAGLAALFVVRGRRGR